MTSPFWKWGTLFIALIFIGCNVLLLMKVGSEQQEVRMNADAISNLSQLHRSVRSLTRVLMESPGNTGQWEQLYTGYERASARINMEEAAAQDYSRYILTADSCVIKIAALNDRLEYNQLAPQQHEEIESSFISLMHLALDNIEDAINKIRRDQGMLSADLASKLRLLGWLVIVSCLLAIIINIMFWKYQRDVAARKKAEDALQDAFSRIFDLYNNAPCGYHSLAHDATIIDMNATELKWLGYTREEVVGRMNFSQMMSPAYVDAFHEKFEEFKKTGEARDMEFVMKRKNGSTFPVSITSAAIFENGKYIHSRSTVFDITSRKLVEEENENKNIAVLNAYKKLEGSARELKAVNSELEAFSYSISHDLRAPLRAINGYAQILEEDYNDKLDDEGKRLIGIVRYSAMKMGRLIDDLLSFSRLGRKEVKRSVLDMNELVNSTLRELERNGTVAAEVKVGELPPAWGDYSLISQVMYNLLSNAVKYSSKKESPLVEIGAQATADEHIYFVKDNGAGFDMQYANKLFGVFQRLHHENEFEGTGVGLAIVEKIVTRHGGRVWAEGTPGEGACFYFSLPVR